MCTAFNLNKNVINGCNSDEDIANKSATHFKSVFKNSENARLNEVTRMYVLVLSVIATVISADAYVNSITVKLIESSVKPVVPMISELSIFNMQTLLFS